MAVVLQTDTLRYVIGNDGRNLHFTEKRTGTDHLRRQPLSRCASVCRGPRVRRHGGALADGRLAVDFGRAAPRP